MSRVIVSLLAILIIATAILFITWTLLAFLYYDTSGDNFHGGTSINSSIKSSNISPTTPTISGKIERGGEEGVKLEDSFEEESGNFDKISEVVVPFKLAPGGDESDSALWFPSAPNRFSPPSKAHYDSGQFRPLAALIWDPHPVYKFNAFSKLFTLVLSPADDFIVPGLRVTTHESNFTWRDEAHDEGRGGSKCFYRGYLEGDEKSSVAVSLCNGMTGHIRTSSGSYFIEPTEKWKVPNSSLRHIIYKISPISFLNPEDSESTDHHPSILHINSSSYDGNKKFHESQEEDHHGRKKRSMSKERYVELMVVTDSTMTAYHGDNLKHYVLTLLSIVALVYKDASIGNPVNIALVKFHVLRDKDFTWKSDRNSNELRTNLIGSSSGASGTQGAFGISASEMLRNFCKWQKEHNNEDDSSVDHHDTALLLTRETICRNPWLYKCDTLGLAELGTMCDHYASCAIVQDNGLSAAFTIAHELGHVLNMPHDDDTKCLSFPSRSTSSRSSGVQQAHYVMSRMLDHNTYPWAFSRCSRHYLTEFLDAGHGYCLEDQPVGNMLENEGNSLSGSSRPQPGEIFSENRQCQLVFGAQSQLCSYMPVCRRLWCTTGESGEDKGCRTQHMPWADGTPCSRDKWCQRGVCVVRDLEKLRRVDGEWGHWLPYGDCSRSCGGGVRRSVRECDNPLPSNGGKYCIGPRVRYESCNTHECSGEHKDFRAEQCGEFNQDNFNIQGLPKDVQWVPKYAGISPKDRCKLFCRVSGSSAYYLLKEKVIDGTQCGPDTFDICVNGGCQQAGCDRKLNSTKLLDICGVCGGDNGSCQMQSGKYNESRYGYNTVVRIPAGASSLDVRQTGFNDSARDDNYLAIVDPLSIEQYMLNGNFIVSMFRKTVHAGGTVLEYSGSDSVVERINSSRPLKSDLIIQVLSVGKLHPPDIRYQYVISLDEGVSYSWSLSDQWSLCSLLCHGTQSSHPLCLKNRLQEVDGSYCEGSPKPPPSLRPCNTHCNLTWRVIETSPCSVPCGRGVRELMVRCVRQFPSNYSVVSDSFCSAETKLGEEETCYEECSRYRWKYSPFSDCSSRCGDGTMSRQAACVDSNDKTVGAAYCDKLGDPYTTMKCGSNGPCGKWKIDQWTPCSTPCGKGIIKAVYACHQAHPGGGILPHDFCYNDPKPEVERDCEGPPCFKWSVKEWSECSVSCGVGLSSRNVYCIRELNRELVNESHCTSIGLLKPEVTKRCKLTNCPTPTTSTTTTTTTRASTTLPRTHLTSVSPPLFIPKNYRLSNGPKYVHVSSVPDAELDNSIGMIFNEIPKSSPLISEAPYKWRTESWSTCSRGMRSRRVSCVTSNGSRMAEELYCPRPKPHSVQDCNFTPVWVSGNWTRCNSSICLDGVEKRVVECQSRGERGGVITLPDSECKDEPPIKYRPCTSKCSGPLSVRSRTNRGFGSNSIWRTGPWSKCSQMCGGGLKLRQVVCQYENGSLSSECESNLEPESRSYCAPEPCPIWYTSSWSPCSAECGGGSSDRNVECRDSLGHVSPESYCEAEMRPNGTQKCNEEPCSEENETRVKSRFRWVTGLWTHCSKHCGKGVKTRSVECVEVTYDLERSQKRVNESHCGRISKPKAERGCAKFPCPYQWVASDWSECSLPCGYGIQQRTVTCHRVNKFGWVDPDPEFNDVACEALEKPKEYNYCYHADCSSPYRWHVDPWGPCPPSTRCGREVRQRRRVFCIRKADGHRVGRQFCPKDYKPARKKKCPIKPCHPTSCKEVQDSLTFRNSSLPDGNYTLLVGGVNMTLFCSSMSSPTPLEYLPLPDDNYSEIYSKRLISPHSCPANGERVENCECIEDANRRAGYTIFNMIRLNVTNLRVDLEDFRYSRTVSGTPIGYGQSGDCYSSLSCPQGRFSINLQGTKLGVSPTTTWVSQGHKTAMWINKSQDNVRISAKCGGYCGTCSPNRLTGLKLQVTSN